LIVDDPAINQLRGAALQASDRQIAGASDGGAYDLVVSGVTVPTMDGMTLTERISLTAIRSA